MAQRIEIQVDPKGNLNTDFTGFLGDSCYDEADRLAKVLASFGLKVKPGAIRPKSIEQQRIETGQSADQKVRTHEGA